MPRPKTMTAAEKKALKTAMSGHLKELDELTKLKSQLDERLSGCAQAIHGLIGGVSFRFKGEVFQAIKRTNKDDDGNIISERYFVRALGEKRMLDF